MYKLKPRNIYALDETRSIPDAVARTRAMLAACGRSEKELSIFSRGQAYDVVREIQTWPQGATAAGTPLQHQRDIVFTGIRLEGAADDDPLIKDRPEDVDRGILSSVLGYITLYRDTHSQESDAKSNMVCWNTQDFGVIDGCSHGCLYCGAGRQGKSLAVGVNIDDYMQRVVRSVVEEHPGQKCFRLIGWAADNLTLEPEHGAMASFIETLASYEDRYGYFHTASDNVDWIAELPHRDRLIGVWSLTPDAVGELIEPAAPSASARIDAARKCSDWGVPVRFKFKPVVPVRGWREAYAETIERIFKTVRPESLGFALLMWMDLEAVDKCIGLERLDPDLVAAARREADAMNGVRTGPFPHAARADAYRFLLREIRRWDERIPVYVSTESREMWAELKDELGQNPATFICGCNPIEGPGPRMMFSEHLRTSTYFPPEKASACPPVTAPREG